MIADREFGERLLALRDDLGVSGTAVARAAGINPGTLYALENNKQQPRTATLRRLARGFGLSYEEFLARLGEEPPAQTASPLAVGGDGAGPLENEYVYHFVGGEAVDAEYEAAIAERYLELFREEGGTDEAFLLAVRRALALGKLRGHHLAETE